MKKLVLWSLALAMIFGLGIPVAADTPVKLFINGQEANVQGLLINGRTYVPVRYVSETFGAKVDFVNGTVKITTSSGGGIADGTLNAKDLTSLPIRSLGEKFQLGKISYCIDSVTYETKNSKQYVNITFSEESTSSPGEFGLLPAFAYQDGQTTVKLIDYSVTADPDKNKSYRRSFTYRFPYEGQISYIYYYPEGFQKRIKPIAKWTAW
ncbi:copper amine oxidase N-terminal domain-containing protein [Zhaonella formicivorans]|uniref:copper amine oxidase N-terminal domain-containing protein n=1 Tax=Zhaonella formicivorans TaxID=2528593 RepID=UPI001D128B7A|nr:copper amine oxidase N-terminal domain-containing protein [Zhaonella formicivorans]